MIGTDRFHRKHGPDDVNDGVECADFVQMHLCERRPVNRRLGFAKSSE